jgi:hypothetical protein
MVFLLGLGFRFRGNDLGGTRFETPATGYDPRRLISLGSLDLEGPSVLANQTRAFDDCWLGGHELS